MFRITWPGELQPLWAGFMVCAGNGEQSMPAKWGPEISLADAYHSLDLSARSVQSRHAILQAIDLYG